MEHRKKAIMASKGGKKPFTGYSKKEIHEAEAMRTSAAGKREFRQHAERQYEKRNSR